MITQSERFTITTDENMRIETEMVSGSFDDHSDAIAVQQKVQNGSFVYEREVIPFAGGQVVTQVDAVRSVAEIDLDVQRTVGQQSHCHVIGVRKRSASVEQYRIAYQSLFLDINSIERNYQSKSMKFVNF